MEQTLPASGATVLSRAHGGGGEGSGFLTCCFQRLLQAGHLWLPSHVLENLER